MKQKLILLVLVMISVLGLGSAQFQGDPQLQEYQESDILVNQEENTVTATFYLENTGGSFTNIDDSPWLLEIQPKLQNEFSFTDSLSAIGVSEPDTCDDSKPENVHREMVFDGGEQKEISMTSPLNGDGNLKPGEYDLIAVSTTGCATGDTAVGNPEQVNPYGWQTDIGSFTVEEDSSSSDPVNSDRKWISYSNSNQCFEVSEDSVPSSVESFDSESQCLEEQDTSDLNNTTVAVIFAGLTIILGLVVAWRRDILG